MARSHVKANEIALRGEQNAPYVDIVLAYSIFLFIDYGP